MFYDEAIRIIHADIVRQCDNSVGWLVANKGNKVAPSLQHIRSRFSTTTALSLIRQERHKQYSEDRLFQLSLMEQFFLNKLGDPKNSWKCVGTVNFQTIWEKMCQNYFRDQKDRLRTPATPAYLHKNNDMTPRKVNSPKPDIIIFEGEYIGIIDAKYYDLDKTWPNWTDMVKQFFYAKAFSRDTAFKNINNLFALPENSNMSHKAVVVLNHKQQQLDDEFPPIKLLFLDINEVMENYVSRRSSSSSRDLVFGS